MINKNLRALEKWRDLKFGMFIHFGVYSQLAGEWRGEKIRGLGEWIQCMKKIPSAEYSALAKTFNPVEWDPEAIATLAADAGMKYLVITSKHHDGFALFDSKVSDYNIAKSAYGRDLLKPLVEACRRHGVRPGFYYSQDLDWHDPDGTGNNWDFAEDKKNFAAYLERKVKPQLTELLTNYGDLAVIWFDTPVTLTIEQSKSLADLVHSLQPECVINSRIGHGFGDFTSLGDNQVPGGRFEGFGETAGTINDTWGFKNVDQKWKTPREVIVQLCDLASKGVNYLLNIGPDGQGRVPRETVDCLHSVGAWLRRCGSAVYGTEPNPFPISFPWGGITLAGEKMYLLVTTAGVTELSIGGVLSKPISALFLGYPEGKISFRHANNVLRIEMGPSPDPYVSVIEILFGENPCFDTRLKQLPDGTVLLPAHLAKLTVHEKAAAYCEPPEDLPADVRIQFSKWQILFGPEKPAPWLMQVDPGGWISNWKSTANYIEWAFEVERPGEFEVWVNTVSGKYVPWQGGHRIRISAGNTVCEGILKEETAVSTPRSRYYPENSCRIGTVRFDKAGAINLKLEALEIISERPEGLAVSEIRLVPKKHH